MSAFLNTLSAIFGLMLYRPKSAALIMASGPGGAGSRTRRIYVISGIAAAFSTWAAVAISLHGTGAMRVLGIAVAASGVLALVRTLLICLRKDVAKEETISIKPGV